MIWQKIDSMPCVTEIITRAQEEIKARTGTEVILQIAGFSVEGKEAKKEIIKDLVAAKFKVSWEKIVSKTRERDVVNARHAYMFLARLQKFSFQSIADDCGLKDHTSVVSATRKIKGFYAVGDPLVTAIEEIRKQLPNEIKIN